MAEIHHNHPQVKPVDQIQEMDDGGALNELKTRKKTGMVEWYDGEKTWCGTNMDPATSETVSANGIEKSSMQLQEKLTTFLPEDCGKERLQFSP